MVLALCVDSLPLHLSACVYVNVFCVYVCGGYYYIRVIVFVLFFSHSFFLGSFL